MGHNGLEMFPNIRVVERMRNLDTHEKPTGSTERKLSQISVNQIFI